MLDVRGLVAGYRARQIVQGIDLHVRSGEVVALIGHNGAGKSTLLRSVFHLLPPWSGTVTFPGTSGSPSPPALLRQGVGYLPQGSQIFSQLSVLDNIRLATAVFADRTVRADGIERALRLFPSLVPRRRQRAGTLSGGERQTLALACAMSLEPRLLLLDEPSLGLAPAQAREALHLIRDICKSKAVGALIVEQKVRAVLQVADRVYVLRHGSITYDGAPAALLDEQMLRTVFL